MGQWTGEIFPGGRGLLGHFAGRVEDDHREVEIRALG
jgi:hypothetical protein